MKLFDCFGASGYHSSVITSFGVDFPAYETIVLPRMREAGCNNNVLVVDGRMLAQALSDSDRRPKAAGRRYSVVGAKAEGVFHPKLVVQLGKTAGRLLVASANMTAAGLAGNLEVVGEVRTDESDRKAVPVFRAVVQCLKRFFESDSVAGRQLEWALTRARWLRSSGPDEAVVELEGGGAVAFLGSDSVRGIGERFVELVGERSVRRLVVVSPYWDPDLSALRHLMRRLNPAETAVVIQPGSALFPTHAWSGVQNARLFDIARAGIAGASRFAHAKLIVAETESADCVLFGSANCTEAALGRGDRASVNEEACLYRELGAGECAEMLGLQASLESSNAIQVADIPPFSPGDTIELNELEQSLPGRFELSVTELRWWPAGRFDSGSAKLALFDQAGMQLDARLDCSDPTRHPVSFRCQAASVPFFALARSGDVESSLAVVAIEQAIHDAQRRTKSKGVERALSDMDDQEDSEGLWLLDVIQRIHAAEHEGEGDDELPRSVGRPKFGDDESVSRKLSYQEFIAGRSAQGCVSQPSTSRLAASHQESVRAFLNALIGRGRGAASSAEDGDLPPAAQLPMGDETENGAGAVEQGEALETAPAGTSLEDEKRKERLRRRLKFVRDSQTGLAQGVEHFIEVLRDDTKQRMLGVIDLLRLRAVLMVVLGAGSRKLDLLPGNAAADPSRRELLPSDGDLSWRRLVGMLLYAFFRNRTSSAGPLLDHVVLELAEGEGLPEDVLECWATCYWALCASRVAVNERGERYKLSQNDERLALNVYRYTQLVPSAALNESLDEVFAGMSHRYGERIGAASDDVRNEHSQLLEAARRLAESASATELSR